VLECRPANEGEAKAAAAVAVAREPPVGDGAVSEDGNEASGDMSGSGRPCEDGDEDEGRLTRDRTREE
jgi:hypothetical protein